MVAPPGVGVPPSHEDAVEDVGNTFRASCDEDTAQNNEEEEEEEVDPPCMERRSKLAHDPVVERGKATAPIGQSTERPRTTSSTQTEKAPKQPRATSSKPTKALPKMRMVIPTISG